MHLVIGRKGGELISIDTYEKVEHAVLKQYELEKEGCDVERYQVGGAASIHSEGS